MTDGEIALLRRLYMYAFGSNGTLHLICYHVSECGVAVYDKSPAEGSADVFLE